MALLWKVMIQVDIVSYSHNHILANINEKNNNFSWRLTGFYRDLDKSKREQSWQLLKSLKPDYRTPQMVIGDFNEILFQNEEVRGKPKSEWPMSNIRQAIEHCQLLTLAQRGNIYTYIYIDRATNMKTPPLRRNDQTAPSSVKNERPIIIIPLQKIQQQEIQITNPLQFSATKRTSQTGRLHVYFDMKIVGTWRMIVRQS